MRCTGGSVVAVRPLQVWVVKPWIVAGDNATLQKIFDKGLKVRAGDKVQFSWENSFGIHNVALMKSLAAYKSCDIKGIKTTLGDGMKRTYTTSRLKKKGKYYFVCAASDLPCRLLHCMAGQKITVTVK